VTDRLALWDFDGTLAFRPGLWSGCVMEVLDALEPGHGVTIDRVRAGLQGRFPWHRPDERHAYPGDAERWWQAVDQLIADALAGAGVERGRCAELAHAAHARFIDPTVGWRLFDDALPALSRLGEAGWTNVIVSNHVPELAELVAGLGLEPLVARVFSSALVGFEKPNPELFRHVYRACGSPDEIWMVGDNPVADVAGAEAVGYRAILVHSHAGDVRRRAAGPLAAAEIILGS
jgi:putative hydrolase of the HAD superfamily